ncbi:MAG: sugar ABC transporter permease [Anaerolineales bacterium]|nr:sugar ABC transporter permease [Anaerolineales bacterium]
MSSQPLANTAETSLSTPKRKRRIDKDTLLGIIFLTPSVIAIGIFVYGFIAWSMRVSLSDWKGLNPDYTWAGLANYIALMQDPRFHIDIRNTIIFTVLFMGGCLLLGLTLAVLLDQGIRGEGIFRSLYLFPMAISFIVTGVVWRWLMNPAQGSRMSGLNLLFSQLGLDFLVNQWYTTPTIGIAAIAIPAVWQMSGYTMALYLGGLRAIPDSLREAARVDGATEAQLYWYHILPLMRPITLSALIILGHTSLKVFDLIVAIAGKQVALDVPATYMWTTTYDGNFYSRGASIGIVMLLSVALLVIPYLFYSLRNEADL